MENSFSVEAIPTTVIERDPYEDDPATKVMVILFRVNMQHVDTKEPHVMDVQEMFSDLEPALIVHCCDHFCLKDPFGSFMMILDKNIEKLVLKEMKWRIASYMDQHKCEIVNKGRFNFITVVEDMAHYPFQVQRYGYHPIQYLRYLSVPASDTPTCAWIQDVEQPGKLKRLDNHVVPLETIRRLHGWGIITQGCYFQMEMENAADKLVDDKGCVLKLEERETSEYNSPRAMKRRKLNQSGV